MFKHFTDWQELYFYYSNIYYNRSNPSHFQVRRGLMLLEDYLEAVLYGTLYKYDMTVFQEDVIQGKYSYFSDVMTDWQKSYAKPDIIDSTEQAINTLINQIEEDIKLSRLSWGIYAKWATLIYYHILDRELLYSFASTINDLHRNHDLNLFTLTLMLGLSHLYNLNLTDQEIIFYIKSFDKDKRISLIETLCSSPWLCTIVSLEMYSILMSDDYKVSIADLEIYYTDKEVKNE